MCRMSINFMLISVLRQKSVKRAVIIRNIRSIGIAAPVKFDNYTAIVPNITESIEKCTVVKAAVAEFKAVPFFAAVGIMDVYNMSAQSLYSVNRGNIRAACLLDVKHKFCGISQSIRHFYKEVQRASRTPRNIFLHHRNAELRRRVLQPRITLKVALVGTFILRLVSVQDKILCAELIHISEKSLVIIKHIIHSALILRKEHHGLDTAGVRVYRRYLYTIFSLYSQHLGKIWVIQLAVRINKYLCKPYPVFRQLSKRLFKQFGI